MLAFLKTINCSYNILYCRRKVIRDISELFTVKRRTTNYIQIINTLKNSKLKSQISRSLSNGKIHSENVVIMPKVKKLKLKLKLNKLTQEINPRKRKSRSHSKSKHNRKRSKFTVLEGEISHSSRSGLILESGRSTPQSEDSDICIVFDNKHNKLSDAQKKVLTVHTDKSHSPQSEDSDICIVVDRKQEKLKEVQEKDITIHSEDCNTKEIVKNDMNNFNSASGGLSSLNCDNVFQNSHLFYNAASLSGVNGFCDEVQRSDSSCSTDNELPVEKEDSVSHTNMEPNEGTPGKLVNSFNYKDKTRKRLKKLRGWEYTTFGSSTEGIPKATPYSLVFTIMSYNVLSQDLLQNHTYLYHSHDSRYLTWEHRSKILLSEIQEANADILCLQEVQASHLDTFYHQLKDFGYEGIYKQRTGGNVDGVAIYFKKNVFKLLDYTSVEYYQPGIELLNRHNVGLIAKLTVKKNPKKHLIIATTHLLFNPKRHDIKLAQMQILLTEVERFAFEDLRHTTNTYWPVIITGDMNFEPNTGVYKLLTDGMFRYEGCNRMLKNDSYGQLLGRGLLPQNMAILDTCQHWGILCRRLIDKINHKNELKLLKIYNTDHQNIMRRMNMVSEVPKSFEEFIEKAKEVGLKNNFVTHFGSSTIPPMPMGGYSTGQLNHNLHLRSVYTQEPGPYSKSEVTTNQGKWVTVDYIFYSCIKNQTDEILIEGNLKLLSKYKLLTSSQAYSLGPIPNKASPSDHYPLLATFFYKF